MPSLIDCVSCWWCQCGDKSCWTTRKIPQVQQGNYRCSSPTHWTLWGIEFPSQAFQAKTQRCHQCILQKHWGVESIQSPLSSIPFSCSHGMRHFLHPRAICRTIESCGYHRPHPHIVSHAGLWIGTIGFVCICPSPCMQACGLHLDEILASGRRLMSCTRKALQVWLPVRISSSLVLHEALSSQCNCCRHWGVWQRPGHLVWIHPYQWLQCHKFQFLSNCSRSSDSLRDSQWWCPCEGHHRWGLCRYRTSARNVQSLRSSVHLRHSKVQGWIRPVECLSMPFSGLFPSCASFLQWYQQIQFVHQLSLCCGGSGWPLGDQCISWSFRGQSLYSSHEHIPHSSHVPCNDPLHNEGRPFVALGTSLIWPKWFLCRHLVSNRKVQIHTHKSVSRIFHV